MTTWAQVGAGAGGPGAGAAKAHLVTLLEGVTFCISDAAGDIRPATTQGFFFGDSRFMSRWELTVDGARLDPVAATVDVPYSGTFVVRERPRPGTADSTLVVTRRRAVGHGFREDVELHNFDNLPRHVCVELRMDADFAGLFDVKRGNVAPARWGEFGHAAVDASRLRFSYRQGATFRAVEVTVTGDAVVEPSLVRWDLHLDRHGTAAICVEVMCEIGEERIEPRYRCGEPVDASVPAIRFADWRSRTSTVTSSLESLDHAVARGIADLGALRMVDPDHPERGIVAAGAPWYMTLFGRDSILTSWMALIADRDLALGVAQTLARFQGTRDDPDTEEQPGRILHEMRFGAAQSSSLRHADVYYGTADATPLFVMLVGELLRWGCSPIELEPLLPAVDRALAWIDVAGDADGDGFVEYSTMVPHGLVNQGWKDSWDGVTHADGSLLRAPIALCEVQAYLYGAYLARAELADAFGDPTTSSRMQARAAALRQRFDEAFWLPEREAYALALDHDKRPSDAIASNMGHCLWTGIVLPERAAAVGRWLASDEMFSGWGIRTLASSMGAFNPISYHNGSVWPHDSAICTAGLFRYGLEEEAHSVLHGLLDLAARHDGRLPELVAGIDRRSVPEPVPYPNSCSPQAWAAAAPLLLTRALLGFEPNLPRGVVAVRPSLPESLDELQVAGVMLGDSTVTVSATRAGGVTVDGLPDGIVATGP